MCQAQQVEPSVDCPPGGRGHSHRQCHHHGQLPGPAWTSHVRALTLLPHLQNWGGEGQDLRRALRSPMLWYYSTPKVFSLPCDGLDNIFFSWAYFIVRMPYGMHTMNGICVHRLFLWLLRLPVNSGIVVLTFWGVRTYPQIFCYARGWWPLTLHIYLRLNLCLK